MYSFVRFTRTVNLSEQRCNTQLARGFRKHKESILYTLYSISRSGTFKPKRCFKNSFLSSIFVCSKYPKLHLILFCTETDITKMVAPLPCKVCCRLLHKLQETVFVIKINIVRQCQKFVWRTVRTVLSLLVILVHNSNIEFPYHKVIYKVFKVFHYVSLEDDIMILLMLDELNLFNLIP